MKRESAVAFSGDLGLKVLRSEFGSPGIREVTLKECVRLGFPRMGLEPEVKDWRTRNLPHLVRGMRDIRHANRGRAPTFIGFLHLAKILRDGTRIEYGLAGARVVTTVWAELLVDSLIADVDISDHNFHGIGTGVTAEAIGDTALVTELTTEYVPDNVRATGTQVEASSVIYRTVGTNTVDSAVALREHGIFDQAATGGGILMDRSLFALINLSSGESLQSTYELTITAGG